MNVTQPLRFMLGWMADFLEIVVAIEAKTLHQLSDDLPNSRLKY